MDDATVPPEPKHPASKCEPIRELFSLVGDKWTMSVFRALRDERLRFKEVHRAIPGISQRVLTVSLRNLERDGLVLRTVYPTVPPRVEYELTARGRSLTEPLAHIANWVIANQAAIEESRRHFDERAEVGEASAALTKT